MIWLKFTRLLHFHPLAIGLLGCSLMILSLWSLLAKFVFSQFAKPFLSIWATI